MIKDSPFEFQKKIVLYNNLFYMHTHIGTVL